MASKRVRSMSSPPAITGEDADSSTKSYTAKELRALIACDNWQNEKLSHYIPGGFMPCSIGQFIGAQNQYKIIRKIGWGTFSTVWLCKDTRDTEYSAIKISRAKTIHIKDAKDEITMLEYIRELNPQHPSLNKLILFKDHFLENSIHGQHICMKFEVMGPSMWDVYAKWYNNGIDLPVVKTILKQVLEAVVYLHDVCHVIHCDIKLDNILLCVSDSYIKQMVDQVGAFTAMGMQFPISYQSSLATNTQHTLYGKPESLQSLTDTLAALKESHDDNILCSSKASSHRDKKHSPVNPIFLSKNIKVKLADLGCACRSDNTHNRIIQTVEYRALEVILGAGFSYTADIWSIGVLAAKLATGIFLFVPNGQDEISYTSFQLALIWSLLNGIPKHVAERGIEFEKYFNSNGELIQFPANRIRICNFESELMGNVKCDKNEISLFIKFIMSLLEPDAYLRPKAAEVLLLDWIKD